MLVNSFIRHLGRIRAAKILLALSLLFSIAIAFFDRRSFSGGGSGGDSKASKKRER